MGVVVHGCATRSGALETAGTPQGSPFQPGMTFSFSAMARGADVVSDLDLDRVFERLERQAGVAREHARLLLSRLRRIQRLAFSSRCMSG